jgi:hypothetical protein
MLLSYGISGLLAIGTGAPVDKSTYPVCVASLKQEKSFLNILFTIFYIIANNNKIRES